MKKQVVLIWFLLVFATGVFAKEKHRGIRISDETAPELFGAYDFQSLKDVKINMERGSQVTLSHFYQPMGSLKETTWNVSSVKVTLPMTFIRVGLNIDRSNLSSLGNKFRASEMAYRFGAQIDQAYKNGDSIYFGVKIAPRGYFPGFSFKGGISWLMGRGASGCFDIQGLSFGHEKSYASVSVGFTKAFSKHDFTVKPYWAATSKSKINIIIHEKIFFHDRQRSLLFSFISGYFPDDNIFIDFDSIMNKRYRLSCQGMLPFFRSYTILLPSCGVDYAQYSNGHFSPNWYMQLGVRMNI